MTIPPLPIASFFGIVFMSIYKRRSDMLLAIRYTLFAVYRMNRMKHREWTRLSTIAFSSSDGTSVPAVCCYHWFFPAVLLSSDAFIHSFLFSTIFPHFCDDDSTGRFQNHLVFYSSITMSSKLCNKASPDQIWCPISSTFPLLILAFFYVLCTGTVNCTN
jgi:hypothetical protein